MATSNTTRDHEQIRQWAEERGGKPAYVKSTGSGEDIGILRIDFPGYSGEGSLEPISWEDWFDKFDERNLALLYQEETAEGERSNFNKIVSAETAEEAESGGRGRNRKSGSSKKSSSKKSGGTSKKSASKKAGSNTSASKKSTSKKSGGRGSNLKRTAGSPAKKKSSSNSSSSKKSSSKKASSSKASSKKSSSKKSATKKRR